MGVTVCLSFDFDAISVWVGPRNSKSPVLVSRGEFGVVGAERLIELMDEQQIPTTWFVPGHTIDTFPDVCQRVADAGHEIGYHGYCHEAPTSQRPEADERAILERSIECVEKISGATPVGHRVPGGNPGDRWIGLLVEYGFAYDSSMAANDYTPYFCRTGDSVRTDGPHEFGQEVDLVELPFDYNLDDWPYFTHDLAGRLEGLRSPNEVYDIWAADFDYLYRKIGSGVFVLTMHPQCIGKGSRMLMLERLIEHFKEHDGVRFTTMAQAAADFRAMARQ